MDRLWVPLLKDVTLEEFVEDTMDFLNRRLKKGRSLPSQNVAFYFGGCQQKLSTTEELKRAWPLLFEDAISLCWEFEDLQDEALSYFGWVTQKKGLCETGDVRS